MNIKKEFIKDFPILKGNKKNPYIILFDAYTGMGKSTVAKVISKKDSSVILNKDEVKVWLNNHNRTNIDKQELQNYRLELLLKNNNSCICDSCFCHNWKEKIKYFDNLKVKYYIIRLICSEDVIKERLNIRNKLNNDYSKGTYKDYLWMKENVELVDDKLINYIVNTEKNIENQINEFIKKYSLDNK